MPISPPTYAELFEGIRRRLEEELGISHWGEGSVAGALARTEAAYLRDLWEAVSQVEEQTDPATARGIYLDRIGETFGVRRKGPEAASTVGRGPALKFTNSGGVDQTVPAGTRIWNGADEELAFFTVSGVTVPAGGEAYVDVVAASPGEHYNVGTGELTHHNAGMRQLAVTNVRPIGGGAFSESDAAYRFRISEAITSRRGGTEAAIRQAVLALPGVREVLLRPGARGTGTLDIIVVPIDRYLSASIKAAAEEAVEEVVAAGISWRVKSPIPKRVSVRVRLRVREGVTIEEVRAQVQEAVLGYLDNLRPADGGPGSELVYNELVSRVQDASPDIVDSEIRLFLEGEPMLATNLVPEPGERFVAGSVTVT